MVPHIHHEVLQRNNINFLIDDTPLDKLICLVAPYGCGKTLAVISWLQGRQASWLNVDNSLDDDDSFFRALKGELVQINIYEKILVIDNFHFIKNSQLLRRIKDYIYECLGKIRIIIISRAELNPIFNDLILKKQVCLITINELNFSTEEITDYFVMNDSYVPMRDIIKLKNDTEGWPAALNVVLVLSRSGTVAYKEAARSYVMSFFETEIWSGLDNDIKDFLLKTSILTELTPYSSNAVTDIGATLPYLNYLFQNGLFISRLNERYTYQYHKVFKDFLTEKLINSSLDERYLYKKAAWWLYERNEIPQAFTYFFKARDLYGIGQTLKIINPSDLGIEHFLELIGCITELDLSELKPYPVIVARIALVEYLKGNISKMQSLYHIFEGWVEPGILDISSEEYAEYVWEVGWLCYLDPDESMGINQKHLEWANYSDYVPHFKELHLSRAAALRFPSIIRGIRDYASGVLLVEDVLQNAEKYGFKTFHEEHSIWETYLMLAEYKYETEYFDKSEEIVRWIMPLVEERGYTDFYFICTAILTKLLRATDRVDEIAPQTERLREMIMFNNHHFLLPNFHAFEMRNLIALSYTEFTENFIKENEDYKYKPYFYLLYRHFTFVHGLIATDIYNEALLILGNIELLCHKYSRATDLIDVNILKAIALYKLNQEDGACKHLVEALNSAQNYGYIRMFSDNAKAIWPILDLVRKEMTGSYIKNVVESCKKSLYKIGYKFSSKGYTHIELTKTELKILRQLQSGLSYGEIALANNIKVSTVKTHTHSIYSKLDVDNRTSAVIEAQMRKFIEKETI